MSDHEEVEEGAEEICCFIEMREKMRRFEDFSGMSMRQMINSNGGTRFLAALDHKLFPRMFSSIYQSRRRKRYGAEVLTAAMFVDFYREHLAHFRKTSKEFWTKDCPILQILDSNEFEMATDRVYENDERKFNSDTKPFPLQSFIILSIWTAHFETRKRPLVDFEQHNYVWSKVICVALTLCLLYIIKIISEWYQ